MLKTLPEPTKVRGSGSLQEMEAKTLHEDKRIQEMLCQLSPCAREKALGTLVELLISQQTSSCSQESIDELET